MAHRAAVYYLLVLYTGFCLFISLIVYLCCLSAVKSAAVAEISFNRRVQYPGRALISVMNDGSHQRSVRIALIDPLIGGALIRRCACDRFWCFCICSGKLESTSLEQMEVQVYISFMLVSMNTCIHTWRTVVINK